MTFPLSMPRALAPLVVLLLCLGIAGAVFAAESSSHSGLNSALSSPQDILTAKMRARELMESKDYEQAYQLYLSLLRAEPDDFETNLNLARTAWQAGRLTHAAMAYERLLATLPENSVLRLEYASLLLQMGNTAEAKLQLAEAKRLNPDLEDTAVSQAIKSLERQVATFTWSGRVAGGMIYDSNINTGPSMRGVKIGGIPITLDSRYTEKESLGVYFHALADAAWRADVESDWWVVGDVAGYQRWYESNEPQRDLTYGRGAMGLRYARSDLMIDIRAKAETLLENGDSSVNIYGLESTGVFALTSNLHLMTRAGLEHRSDIANRDRSGTYWWAGPYLRRYFGEANHSIMLGAKVYGSQTREERYEFLGIEPSLTLGFNLPWETQMYVTAAVSNEDYRGPASLLGQDSDRHDHQFRTSVFFSKLVNEHLRVEAGWQYTDNHSNSDLYDYDQHQIMLGLAFHF